MIFVRLKQIWKWKHDWWRMKWWMILKTMKQPNFILHNFWGDKYTNTWFSLLGNFVSCTKKKCPFFFSYTAESSLEKYKYNKINFRGKEFQLNIPEKQCSVSKTTQIGVVDFVRTFLSYSVCFSVPFTSLWSFTICFPQVQKTKQTMVSCMAELRSWVSH